jgi:MscS family membrane protein
MEERNKALRRKIWQRATKHLISTTLLACVGVYLCNVHGNVRQGDISQRLLAAIGVLLFILGATLFLKVLTDATSKVMRHYLNAGRTAAMKFFLNLIGFGAIILSTLTLLEIPIDKLLLGGAAIGVILSVAAQQSLANFFASVVIIISRPFQVCDELSITAGALGGTYKGKIKDIGLTHTKLTVDGKLVMLPNATLLSAGVIIKEHASSSK